MAAEAVEYKEMVMSKKIEWRLRAVTRYQLTRYESDDEQHPMHGTMVMPAGEFDSLSLGMEIGHAMAAKDIAANPNVTVEFDDLNIPHPKVRAKFTCSELRPFRDAPWPDDRDGGVVGLAAVYESGADDGGNACLENRIFGKATPWGNIQMGIANPDAYARFTRGQAYYVDFIPVPAPDDLPIIE